MRALELFVGKIVKVKSGYRTIALRGVKGAVVSWESKKRRDASDLQVFVRFPTIGVRQMSSSQIESV